uniref:EF-hand domain-containing protein n=1 Tax=Zooxanthella nutricula TaxID=1333877 RepID=A0A7S2QNP3_9DINO
MKPAFDELRQNREMELTKAEFLELCPRALPETVDGLFSIFDRHPRNGNISYDEIAAFVLLACDGGSVEEKLESLFPFCDVDGDNLVSADELAAAIRMLYYAQFKDVEYMRFKVDRVVEEAMEGAEGESMTLMHFTEWARSNKPAVSELRDIMQKPILDKTDEEGLPQTWPIQAKMSFDKIKVENPVVELDGDEMTRIIWQMVKEKLIFPFLDMELDYYDLSITYRDETEDNVTLDAAKAVWLHNVGVKCPTITPDEARVLEFNLQQMWPSCGTLLRTKLDGTMFTAPITITNIPRYIPGWEKPIILGRHAQGDIGQACQLVSSAAGTFRLVFEPDGDGAGSAGVESQEAVVHQFTAGGGVMMGMYNTRESVENFAKCCFEHALHEELPLYLSTKRSTLKAYDSLFVDTFENMYQTHYKQPFEERGIWFQHLLINEMVAQVIKSNGGFIWACKNHDGDVLSDLVAQGFGSPGLMVSTLVCPDGKTLMTEAGHGTVTKHYRAFQRGEKTSTNPMACVFAWSRALAHRAKLDGNERLAFFSRALEEACITCVQRGIMSKDMASCAKESPESSEQWMLTEDLLNAFANELRIVLGKPLKATEKAQETPFADSGADVAAATSAGAE